MIFYFGEIFNFDYQSTSSKSILLSLMLDIAFVVHPAAYYFTILSAIHTVLHTTDSFPCLLSGADKHTIKNFKANGNVQLVELIRTNSIHRRSALTETMRLYSTVDKTI